jgi:hypothetical protein
MIGMNPIARMMKRYINMPLKKALPLLFIGALVLVATTGCTDTKNTTQNLSGGGTGAAGVAVKVNSVNTYSQLGSGYAVSTPKAGYKYVVYDVTVTNLNKNDQDMGNPNFFRLTTGDGSAYSYSLDSYNTGNEIDHVSHTNPGEKVLGVVAFEIPQSATPKQLVYNDYSNQVTTNL